MQTGFKDSSAEMAVLSMSLSCKLFNWMSRDN
jgi:hypothetical protein